MNRLWMYQTCDSDACAVNTDLNMVNFPSMVVDATGVENRAEPWMHYIYGARGGMLYFDIASQLSTAWNDPDGLWSPAFGGIGDGTLVYPGTPSAVAGGSAVGIGGNSHIPVASIRLKMIREGLEDYEYLLKCDAVNPTLARNIATTLFAMVGTGANGQPFGSMYNTNAFPSGSPSPSDFADSLETARDQLADCIVPPAPRCGPTNCGGCCDANNHCHGLGEQNFCGNPGQACDDCDQQGFAAHCIQINSCTGAWACMDVTCTAGKPPHGFPACP